MSRRLLRIGIGWAWLAAVVWLSLTPAPPSVAFAASDKLGHFLAYAVLMLWFCALYKSTGARIVFGAAFIAMGVGLELVQGSLGTRSYERADMLANALGVAAGWAIALILPRALRAAGKGTRSEGR